MTSTLTRAPQRLRALLPQRRDDAAVRPPTPALPPATLVTMYALLTISVLAGWFALYATVFSGLQEHRDNAALYKEFRANLSAATVPIGQPIAPGTPIALLRLPAAGLSGEVVVEGTGSDDLATGVGHLRSSPLPGQPGVSQLYGRSLTYGAPFGDIASLAKGTPFTVITGQGTFHYVVDAVRHIGDPLPGPLAADGSRLMLQTSSGSLLSAADPVYVDATLVGKPVPAATAPLAGVPDSEKAFGTDHSHLASLVFWLQGLVGAVLLTVWGMLRWGRWQAWLIGLPVIVALLWGATGAAMTMLPNLV